MNAILSLIAAVSDNGFIGRRGQVPWDLPEDRKRFKALTMGRPVVMGRKTFEAIGRPLDGRMNIVLSRNASFRPEGCLTVPGLYEALSKVPSSTDEVFICGGEDVYRAAMAVADRIYLTTVHIHLEGDARFPAIPGSMTEVRKECWNTVPAATLTVWERRIRPGKGSGS